MKSSDAVFLLPGLLGFERTGNFSRFADRAVSALRGTLEQRFGRAVPVVPIVRLPARSLAARQRALLEALADADAALGGVERVHLVGYCLGGVDAYFLTCKQPLDSPRWPEICSARADAVRTRITSVVSIGSPHFGTHLATLRGTGSLTPKKLLRDPEGARALAQLLPTLVSSVWSKLDEDDLWHSVAREGRKLARFVAEVRRFQRLLPSLAPTAMEELHAKAEPAPGVRRASVVAMTAPVHEASDRLFVEFAKHAAGGNTMSFGSHDPMIVAARHTIRSALGDPARMVRSARAELPSLVEVTTNDGVVNTCRQLMTPHNPDGLLALVIGDHFDLIGYYDRTEGPAGNDREPLTGFLRSGSFFRDDEFFALYRKIGDYIADTVLASERPSEGAAGEAPPADPALQRSKPTRVRPARPRDIRQ